MRRAAIVQFFVETTAYQKMPEIWDDPTRGQVPLGWAFNPALAERFPVGLIHARATATPNDTFMAGDSGYGYLNPGNLVPPRKWSDLPSDLNAWERLCADGYRRWDLKVTGFVIDGYAPAMSDVVKAAYARFSPAGVVAEDPTEIPGGWCSLPAHGPGPGEPDRRCAAGRVIIPDKSHRPRIRHLPHDSVDADRPQATHRRPAQGPSGHRVRRSLYPVRATSQGPRCASFEPVPSTGPSPSALSFIRASLSGEDVSKIGSAHPRPAAHRIVAPGMCCRARTSGRCCHCTRSRSARVAGRRP